MRGNLNTLFWLDNDTKHLENAFTLNVTHLITNCVVAICFWSLQTVWTKLFNTLINYFLIKLILKKVSSRQKIMKNYS